MISSLVVYTAEGTYREHSLSIPILTLHPYSSSTDDKGPVLGRLSEFHISAPLANLDFLLLGWLNVIEAHQKTGQEFPVNLKMCFEGMEESGSEGLDAFIEREKDAFFSGVDAVCISDNYWL